MRPAALALALLLLACGPSEPAEVEPPIAEAPPPAEPETVADETPAPSPFVRLSAAGDLVLNPHAMRAIEDEGSYAPLLEGYAAAVAPEEIAYVNVEQPLVNDEVPLDPGWPRQDTSRPRRSPVLGATPPLADALAEAGVDVAGLANNHAYDQGHVGLARTMAELRRVGIASVGAGTDTDAAYAPVVIEQDGRRIAFVAFTSFFNQHPTDGGALAARLGEDERVLAAIADARQRADLVVAAVHWSRDFAMEARDSERRRARELVDAGADVILGTGPHVLHAVERVESPRGEAVVAYSLGNVGSGMGRTYRLGHAPTRYIHPANVRPEARDGVVLRIAIELDGGEVRAESLEGVPLWAQNNWLAHQRDGAPHRIRIRRLADVEAAVRDERLPVIRAALGDLPLVE